MFDFISPPGAGGGGGGGHAQNTDAYLTTPVTKYLYVDKNRSDSYTENGSITKPFKTIAAATAVATSGCLLKVIPASYSEDVVLPAGVSLEGCGVYRSAITGDVTITAGDVVCLRNLDLLGTTKTLTINSNCMVMDVNAGCAVIVNNDAIVQGWGFHMVGAASGVTPLTMNSTGKFYSFLATIESTGDAPAINQTEGQIVLNTVQAGAGRAAAPVILSTGGTVALLSTQAINSLGGPAVDTSANDATSTSPNIIYGLVAAGNVVCGSKTTLVEGVTFIGVGSLSGTAIVHRPASYIANDSLVSGTTVKDALETLAFQPQPTNLLYVDKGRTDSYTADGTTLRPYKTIQAAIDKIIANGDNSSTIPYAIRIGAGIYAENVVLESDKLVDIGLLGATNRATIINPTTGSAIRSETNNENLSNLHIHDIFTDKLVSLIGPSDGTGFGSDVVFDNCYVHAGVTVKNVNSVNFVGYWEMYGPVLVSNVAASSFVGEAGIKSGATVTIESDGSANYPSGCSGHDIYIVFANCICVPNITYNFVNGGTGTVTFRMGNRIGTTGGTTTVPSGCTLLSYDSSLRGNYVLNAGSALTLSNSHVTGTITGAGTLTLEEKCSQIKNDSSVSGTSVKDALETLAVLPQITKVLHVDKNRTDTYTADGSDDWPFKTIAAGTAVATDGCLLKVVPATYDEDVVLPAGVSLEGYSANRLVISGDMTITAGSAVSLRYLNLTGITKTFTINSNCMLTDGYASCAVVVNNAAIVQAWNFHMTGTASGVTPLTMNSTGKFHSFLATISSTGDAPAINQTAGQVILNTILTGAGRAASPVILSTGGTVALLNSQAINSLGGPAVDLSANAGSASSPNMIAGLVAVGNVVCGTKTTAIEGLRFVSVGTLSGTAILHRPASWIANDSSVSGTTVKDALQTLGKVPDPSALGDNDYVLHVASGVATWVAHT